MEGRIVVLKAWWLFATMQEACAQTVYQRLFSGDTGECRLYISYPNVSPAVGGGARVGDRLKDAMR
jgi:hypothetical protein